ncbi:2-polyprenyl-6-hydroxyphenyl methylase / 3-demethylubiquinone-9 3-methyltransferase [Geosmithia morbida]|uniref:Ubiquinone biosynthesis O-methyltransferase, mitochondrial n=1 Tax=Geosmithia morbida TaxID=1094350 RepID=A0A9P5D8L4_9HYPO|nr:2-polyprenyl-6-hydroxyphenyl methylase / 3-demethylubiquinone-9 3-methyltransferase [Geosmithia morbida]KAF4125644.1 2-polyprenyl-6-hydroxyphenyl methylase / 3-demethylubiquinone-9 3-methyltransferase [Geosmithia morbida]
MASPLRFAAAGLSSLNAAAPRRLAAAAAASIPAAVAPFPRPASRQQQQRRRQQQQRRHISSPSSSKTSSVNPDEVSHFNHLAADWWDPHGSSRLLHLMNPLRHDFIASCLANSGPSSGPGSAAAGLAYLDVGCGGGIFAESAARLPTTRSVTAIDPTPEVLAVARAHARKDPSLASRLTYRQCAIEDLDAAPASFDVVSVFEVIEHIDRPADFLDGVLPFVKPGGWLVMSTIARTWISWFTTNLVAEDLLRIVPPGTHDWNKYINDHELCRYFSEKPGWGVSRVMGVVYVPGLGWREVRGSEKIGNYFLAVRREPEP